MFTAFDRRSQVRLAAVIVLLAALFVTFAGAHAHAATVKPAYVLCSSTYTEVERDSGWKQYNETWGSVKLDSQVIGYFDLEYGGYCGKAYGRASFYINNTLNQCYYTIITQETYSYTNTSRSTSNCYYTYVIVTSVRSMPAGQCMSDMSAFEWYPGNPTNWTANTTNFCP